MLQARFVRCCDRGCSVVLLHGPPGTGKTSLCRALAQKLCIRVEAKTSYLVEVHSDQLFSKWFSESSTNVGLLFKYVNELSTRSEHVFVLLDEVESLAASRDSTASTEPSDAVRVVNSLLTAIDSLRAIPNCLVLCTSNLTQRIDGAFLDRVDLRQYVGLPSLRSRIEILQSCVNELVHKEIVGECDATKDGRLNELMRCSAKACKGLSGRALRKLPLLAHAAIGAHTNTRIPLERFLKSVRTAATHSRKRKM